MGGEGTRGKMVGVGHWGWDTRQETGYQVGMRFQSGVGFQTRDGVPEKGWDSSHGMGYQMQVGFQIGMAGYQTWGDGVCRGG